MRVKKRDLTYEDISFDKVLRRIRVLSTDLAGVDADEIALKVCSRIYDGVSTSELDELAAQMCATLVTTHPDYGTIAARLIVSNHHKNTSPSFSETMGVLYNAKDIHGKPNPLITEELWAIVQAHKEKLNSMIDYQRDYLFDYFGFKTLEKLYLLKVNGKPVERPQHLWMRVALGIHGWDMKEALETYDLMSQKFFTHATPTLFNAGTPIGNLASCFLLGTHDSVTGMYKNISDCAAISKFAGGIGIHISNIRARGSHIRGTNGTSSGIIPMLRVYNDTARHINQAGKRNGSFAMYLEPWHADVEAFLELRKNQGAEEERCRDLFTAMWIPDLFMRRVQDNAEWSLMCPDECPGLQDAVGEEFDALYEKYESEGRFRKKVKAQQIFMSILKSQIETGSPYLCYKDAANKKSNQKNLGTIKSSNLCVAGNTKILTKTGYVPIEYVCNQDIDVWNGCQWSRVRVNQTGENQEMWRIVFSDGSELKCTGYHRFYIQTKYPHKKQNTDIIKTNSVSVVEAKSLIPSMKLIKWELPVIHESQKNLKYAYTAGVFSGDGTVGRSNEELYRPCAFKHTDDSAFCKRHAYKQSLYGGLPKNDMCQAYSYENVKKIALYGEKKKLLPHLEYRLSYVNGNTIDVLLHDDIVDKFTVPHEYNVQSKLQWFAGLADTDGCIVRNGNAIGLQISSVNKSFLDEIRMLLHTLGVHSKVTIMHEERQSLLPNGKGGYSEYDCNAVYRILVGIEGIGKLVQLGFKTYRLNISNVNFNVPSRLRNIQVLSVEKLSERSDTYCFNEPLRHAGIFNGVLTSQCSEIIEYSDENEYATCNLSSIALPAFVTTREDGKKYFDFDKLHRIASIITRNLNKVIDRTMYPTPETERSNRRHRPIGIGVQGLADAYAMLRLPFDSEDAAKLNREIFETIYHGAVESSMLIAKKREELLTEFEDVTTSIERKDEICKHLRMTPEETQLREYRGAYVTFKGSPASHGLLQFDLWETQPEGNWDWETLKQDIQKYGMRNSLLLAPMPTASTSQILGSTECLDENTRVGSFSGTSKRIKNFYKKQSVIGYDEITKNSSVSECVNILNQGFKKCVEITFSDGRSITCTPDHKFLTSNGTWMCAKDMLVGSTKVKTIYRNIDDNEDDEIGINYKKTFGDYNFNFDNLEEREKFHAFVRILGLVSSDGHTEPTKYATLYVGCNYDINMVCEDLKLLDEIPNIKKNTHGYALQLHSSLSFALYDACPVHGKKVHGNIQVPSFLLEEVCPLSLVREYIASHFGGDGTAPMLKRDKSCDHPILDKPYLSHSYSDVGYENIHKYMSTMSKLLYDRFGIESKLVTRKQYGDGYRSKNYETMILKLVFTDFDFCDKIGFRYCVQKMYRNDISRAYKSYVRCVQHEKQSLLQQCLKLRECKFSVAKAVKEVNENNKVMFKNATPTIDDLRTYEKHMRVARSTNMCIDYFLQDIECEFAFEKKYIVDKQCSTAPFYSLTVLNVKETDVKHVWDLSIDKVHSFDANGIIVHNCFEPITSTIFQRQTLAGEFTIINKHLISDLVSLGLWSTEMKNRILTGNGSIQHVEEIPAEIRALYKTAWELKQKVLIDQAADRGIYVCQSQSLNLFVEDPDFSKLTNMHFYAWKRGLKTGIYYLRTRPKAKISAFSIDPQSSPVIAKTSPIEECTMCSA